METLKSIQQDSDSPEFILRKIQSMASDMDSNFTQRKVISLIEKHILEHLGYNPQTDGIFLKETQEGYITEDEAYYKALIEVVSKSDKEYVGCNTAFFIINIKITQQKIKIRKLDSWVGVENEREFNRFSYLSEIVLCEKEEKAPNEGAPTTGHASISPKSESIQPSQQLNLF